MWHIAIFVATRNCKWVHKTNSHICVDKRRKKSFVHIITNLTTPTQYVSSLKKRMMDGDLKGMKSHDYHVMMQEILLLCMQHLMTKDCKIAIICLCQGCGPNKNGGVEKWCGNHISIAREGISTIIFWCHDTSVNSFS